MISRKKIVYFLFTLVFFALTSCDKREADSSKSHDQNISKDKSDILELYGKWAAAVEEGDRQQYVDILDENVVLIAPGAGDIVGKADYATFLFPVFENATYKIEPVGSFDIELLSDFAMVRYDYIVHVTMKEGFDNITNSDAALTKMTNNSKYLDVLKRQDSGDWKVFRHMWNEGPKND